VRTLWINQCLWEAWINQRLWEVGLNQPLWEAWINQRLWEAWLRAAPDSQPAAGRLPRQQSAELPGTAAAQRERISRLDSDWERHNPEGNKNTYVYLRT